MSRRAERLQRNCPTRREENVDVDVTTVSQTAGGKTARDIWTGGHCTGQWGQAGQSNI